MIGGDVINTVWCGRRIWILCKERNSTSECAIYVRNTSAARVVSVGDIVWWQAGKAYWTPKEFRLSAEEGMKLGHKAGRHYDIVLEKLGYSGVSEPSKPEACDRFEAGDYDNDICEHCQMTSRNHKEFQK